MDKRLDAVVKTRSEEPGMAKKREDTSVKMPRDIVLKAKIVAGKKGITLAEYFGDMVRPIVQRDWQKTIQQISDEEQESK